MADTNFIDSQTPVVASWLNDVNDAVYSAIGNGTTAPTTHAEVLANIGAAPSSFVSNLAASSGSSLVGNIASGTGATARTVQAKLRDVVSVKDFGAVGNGVADDTNAFKNALAASNSVYVPDGTYKITSTIDIDKSNVTVYGNGNSSVIYFAPTADDILFNVANATPANLILFINFFNLGIKAEYPNTYRKIAFSFTDASLVLVENVNSLDYSWTGTSNNSIFFYFRGRDQHTIRNCYMAADLPVYVDTNPNSTTYQFDVYHFQDLAMQILAANNYAITFNSGVNISQWLVDGRCIALQGKGGIYLSDSSSTTATSSMITIENFRIESGVSSGGAAGGYGIFLNFNPGGPKCGNIRISNSSVNDPTCNGYYLNHVSIVELENINCGFGATNTALLLNEVSFAKITALGVGHNSAATQYTNMYGRYVSVPYWTAGTTNASIDFAIYTLYTSDTPTQYLQYDNRVRKWNHTFSMANSTTQTLPVVPLGGSMFVKVSCDYGYALYYVKYSSATLISGSSGMGVGSGTMYLTVSSGAVSFTNNSAGTQTVVFTTEGV